MRISSCSKSPGVIPIAALIFWLQGQGANADSLDHWTTQQLSTNKFGLTSVAYGNGCFVAAGTYSDYGVLVSSANGFDWKVRQDGGVTGVAPMWGLNVNFGEGRFIAVSAWGGTATSADGTNWILGSVDAFPTPGFSLYLHGATYGGGRYVAVGQLESGGTVSNIVTSTDGVSWNLQRSHPTDAGMIVDVAHGAGKFVAIGANDGFIYTSPDAASWTRRTIPGGTAISFCSNIFVVPYAAGTNLVSADGIAWSLKNTGVSNTLGKVIFANGLFLARTGNSLTTSTDGTNWFQYSQNIPGTSLACDGSHLVTVASTYASGIYYNGFVYTSDVLVGVRMTNSPARRIALSGLVGRSYRVEYTDDLRASTISWQSLTTLQLPGTPYLVADHTASNRSSRFYRGVLLP